MLARKCLVKTSNLHMLLVITRAAFTCGSPTAPTVVLASPSPLWPSTTHTSLHEHKQKAQQVHVACCAAPKAQQQDGMAACRTSHQTVILWHVAATPLRQ